MLAPITGLAVTVSIFFVALRHATAIAAADIAMVIEAGPIATATMLGITPQARFAAIGQISITISKTIIADWAAQAVDAFGLAVRIIARDTTPTTVSGVTP